MTGAAQGYGVVKGILVYKQCSAAVYPLDMRFVVKPLGTSQTFESKTVAPGSANEAAALLRGFVDELCESGWEERHFAVIGMKVLDDERVCQGHSLQTLWDTLHTSYGAEDASTACWTVRFDAKDISTGAARVVVNPDGFDWFARQLPQ
jgi:hypothetical protein